MKILHTSDWHLGRRPTGREGEYTRARYEDYFKSVEWIVDEALKEKVNLLIVSGDIFDRSTIGPDVLYKTEKILRRLKDGGIKVLVVEGNHDYMAREGQSWIDYLEKEDYLVKLEVRDEGSGRPRFKSVTIGGMNFYGIQYSPLQIEDYLLKLSREVKGKNNILILHAGLDDEERIFGCVKSELLDTLRNHFTYVAGGHLHSFQFYPRNDPFFFIPGSPEYFNLDEREDKRIVIFDPSDVGNYTTRDTFKRKLVRRRYRYTPDLLEIIERDMRNMGEEIESALVVVEVKSSYDPNLASRIEKLVNGFPVLKTIVKIHDEVVDVSVDYRNWSLNRIEIEAIKSWKNIFSRYAKRVSDTIRNFRQLKDEIENLSRDEMIERACEELEELVEFIYRSENEGMKNEDREGQADKFQEPREG